jgi:hypothetical protein
MDDGAARGPSLVLAGRGDLFLSIIRRGRTTRFAAHKRARAPIPAGGAGILIRIKKN